MRSVLILGGRAPVALDHARRFSAQGWRVHVADSVSFNLSAYSNLVHCTKRLPAPRYTGAAFVGELNHYLIEHRIDLLLPTCEEVFFVARFRAMLPIQLCVVVDEFDKLRQLHSKLSFLDQAANCGAIIPSSHAVRTLEQARAWSNGKPVVLKPEFSRFGVFVRIYPNGIPHDAPALASLDNWVAQEYCAGEELCSYSIAYAGQLLAHAAYRPLYRIGCSSSFYFEPIEAPQINRFVQAFAAKTVFTGQLSFDWIRNNNGQCTVLECNPRATSGLHLFDSTAAIPDALAGSSSNSLTADKSSPRMIAGLMLTAGLLQSIRDGQLTRWRRNYARASDVITMTTDRRPILGALTDLLAYAYAARNNACSIREAATRDIEWDGQPIHLEP